VDQPAHPSGVTRWRRLGSRDRKKGYHQVWRTLLNLLVQSKRLDGSLISLDGTFIPSQEFADQTGYSGKHRAVGTKQSPIVDCSGTPLAVSVAPGNYHDRAMGFLTLANVYTPPPILRGILPDAAKAAEPTLLADKGYDSLRFRQFVWERGVRSLIPPRTCVPADQSVGELHTDDGASSGSAMWSNARSVGSRASVDSGTGWIEQGHRLRLLAVRQSSSPARDARWPRPARPATPQLPDRLIGR
jgi:hypothetical protein